MNRDLSNYVANQAARRAYSRRKIADAVTPMVTQAQATVWCRQAGHQREVLRERVVYDAHIQERMVKMLVGSMVLGAFGIIGLQDAWLWLRSGQAASSLTIADMVLGALSLGLAGVALLFCWKAWTLRNSSPFSELTVAEVASAHALRAAVGEEHKSPPRGWELPVMVFGHVVEGAAFAFLALLGLGNLPTNIGLAFAAVVGVLITGSVAQLGRLHAQRGLTLKGCEMYRAEARLARELKEAGDPRAEAQAQVAEQLRVYLSAANGKQFEAPPSRLGIGLLWFLLGALVCLALAMRILYGSAMGPGAILGAVMLAVATLLVFAANFRLMERFLSVAGDSGVRAMTISERFQTVASFTSVADAHRKESDLFFDQVMMEASRVHYAVVEARDPARPRIVLAFELPLVKAHPAAGEAEVRGDVPPSRPPKPDFGAAFRWSPQSIRSIVVRPASEVSDVAG